MRYSPVSVKLVVVSLNVMNPVVKRKKPRATGRVSKTLLKLRAPRHVWENMSSSESSCPSENEVDETAAPATIAIPDYLKSPSPIANRLRPRLRPKK